ncbi:peptidoglycan-recognition protein SD-like [Chelonus insularis]|uniref:peptidoglycan-recognition protein SD-like n=1 Tax=Chelonus insularis TaxID=460826 RepID=UPI0015891183|nr:peptidoglycan-recognition protein SD-like [Chelonus insularis]
MNVFKTLRTVIFFVYLMVNVQALPRLTYLKLDDWALDPIPTFQWIRMPSIPQYVVITDTNTQICPYDKYCSFFLNYIINYESLRQPTKSIAAHFYIGGDGRIYEGRGWNFMGGNNFGCDDNTSIIEISFIGNFKSSAFPLVQFKAANKLIKYGIKSGKLSKHYKLFGGWQLNNEFVMTNKSNIELIETWPHWDENGSICSDGFSNYIPVIY